MILVTEISCVTWRASVLNIEYYFNNIEVYMQEHHQTGFEKLPVRVAVRRFPDHPVDFLCYL